MALSICPAAAAAIAASLALFRRAPYPPVRPGRTTPRRSLPSRNRSKPSLISSSAMLRESSLSTGRSPRWNRRMKRGMARARSGSVPVVCRREPPFFAPGLRPGDPSAWPGDDPDRNEIAAGGGQAGQEGAPGHVDNAERQRPVLQRCQIGHVVSAIGDQP